jgi:hypothetical protein
MSTLMLIAVACSTPPPSAPPTTEPSPAVTGLATDTAPRSADPIQSGGPVHGPERDIPAPCIAGGPTLASDAILWISCELAGIEHGPAQIVEYKVASGTQRVLYRSPKSPSGISLLHVSDAWILWAEYNDIRTAADTRILAMRREGGGPIVLEDAQRHPPLAHLMEIALDGSEAYWSLPLVENGEWHGRLMHKRLPDGPSEIAVTAPQGSIITWPTAADGTIAYERSSQTATPQTRVVLRLRDGTEREIGAAPASEPTLGTGFVALKQSERYDQGDLRAYLLGSDERVIPLGAGEAPRASGSFVTWEPSTPADNALRLSVPVHGCTYRLNDLDQPHGFPDVGHGMLAWTHADPAHPGPEGLHIRYVSLLISSDGPCRS